MMGFLIFCQIIFDIAVVGAAIWFYLNKQELLGASSSTGSNGAEQWRKEWDVEKDNYSQQLTVQLRSIRLLYEQAKKLLDEKSTGYFVFPMSQEENELKNLVMEKTETVIPTLIEFEAQKNRLKQESSLDLKTLLTEQLS